MFVMNPGSHSAFKLKSMLPAVVGWGGFLGLGNYCQAGGGSGAAPGYRQACRLWERPEGQDPRSSVTQSVTVRHGAHRVDLLT